MTRCFLEFKYGVKTVSKDFDVKFCIVKRFNRFTGRYRNIKLYYIEFETIWDLEEFTSRYALDFGLKAQYFTVDDEYFDMRLIVTKPKKSKTAIPRIPAPAAATLPVAA